MPTNVDIPSLGESVSEAVLLRWLKEDGESVAAAEPIAELETDKANVDLPAPTAGVLRRAKEAGETVHIGETIARIDDAGAGAAKPAAPASKPTPSAASASSPSSAPSKPKLEDLSPAVRRVVEENKIDPTAVRATGPGGRITKEDVQRHLDERGNGHNAKADESDEADDESDAPPAPEPATKSAPPAKAIAESRTIATHPKPPAEKLTFDSTGTKRVAMSKMRKRIADRLVSAQQTAAILTTFNEVDLHQVMEIRSRHKERFEKQYGVGLGFMSFFARAVVLALREFPRVNASIDGGDIVYNQHVHLGIAVSTDRGLAVPVLRNTDQMGFAQIESEIKRLAAATREGKLGLDELTGGTFTITNGGIFGSLLSTPIINPPQSAILGMHAIQKRPVVTGDDKIEVRPMMYVALSYDHRLIDGRESVTFLVRIKELLEDPTRLMLEI